MSDKIPKPCHARQHLYNIQCTRCDLNWDTDDKDPPKCLTNSEIGRRTLQRIQKELEL